MSNHPNTDDYQRRNSHKIKVAARRIQLEAGTAAIVALAISACGPPLESDRASAAEPVEAAAHSFDNGPTWEPDQETLESALARQRQSPAAPPVEFGGMPAPWGEPDLSHLAAPGVLEQSVSDNAPTWQPNYGRLETYVGSTPPAGPR